MKLELNTTEMLDWQEIWCFRCTHDHGFSHSNGDESDGCSILLRVLIGDDVSEFHPRDADWQSQVPAPVSTEEE